MEALRTPRAGCGKRMRRQLFLPPTCHVHVPPKTGWASWKKQGRRRNSNVSNSSAITSQLPPSCRSDWLRAGRQIYVSIPLGARD